MCWVPISQKQSNFSEKQSSFSFSQKGLAGQNYMESKPSDSLMRWLLIPEDWTPSTLTYTAVEDFRRAHLLMREFRR